MVERRNFLKGALGLAMAGGMNANVQPAGAGANPNRKRLFVASPGVRNYLEYGGHGVLVFDILENHKFVERIPSAGLGEGGQPLNVKGVCACAATGRIYISTLQTLQCLDLAAKKLLWERKYDGGCDRMSMTPDGATIFLPSLEGPHWHIVDGASGDVLAVVRPDSGAHNTIVSLDGREAYLAGLKSPRLTIVDVASRQVARTVGPFSAEIRPFTVDSRRQRCFVNLNKLLGFEIGDLTTGKKLHRVEVAGYSQGPVKRHGCPSHGIGLTPDEREIWLTDAHNQRLHLFDNTQDPPRQMESISLRDEPGWVTFSLDGKHAYPSTGEVIGVATRTPSPISSWSPKANGLSCD